MTKLLLTAIAALTVASAVATTAAEANPAARFTYNKPRGEGHGNPAARFTYNKPRGEGHGNPAARFTFNQPKHQGQKWCLYQKRYIPRNSWCGF